MPAPLGNPVTRHRYDHTMRTVILGPRLPEIEALIESRHATGADLYDEVWEGEYHMAPMARGAHGLLDSEVAVILQSLTRPLGLFASGPFNLGGPDNFRVPDRGIHRRRSNAAWFATAALVVEILSTDDETLEKLPFYAAHGVDEVMIVDPVARSVTWLRLSDGSYAEVDRSTLLDVEIADVAAQIDWPPLDD